MIFSSYSDLKDYSIILTYINQDIVICLPLAEVHNPVVPGHLVELDPGLHRHCTAQAVQCADIHVVVRPVEIQRVAEPGHRGVVHRFDGNTHRALGGFGGPVADPVGEGYSPALGNIGGENEAVARSQLHFGLIGVIDDFEGDGR